jgi:hypothetical protein
MNSIKRRDLLKGLGVLSAAALTTQIGCHNRQPESGISVAPKADITDFTPRLNVILHGMFAVLLDSKKKATTIQAPSVPDHLYFMGIGAVDTSGSSPDLIWTQISRINQSGDFQISIQSPNAKFKRTPRQDMVLIDHDLSKIDRPGTAPYFTITLPWPDDILPLRADTSTVLIGRTVDDNSLSLLQIPTVYVLSYELMPREFPMLKDNTAGTMQKIVGGADGVVRLHLFAESPTGGDLMHPTSALDKLCEMFHDKDDKTALQFQFSSPAQNSVKIGPTGHSSILSCEERAIGELSTACAQLPSIPRPSAQAGGHPMNCMAVFIAS